MMSYTDVAQQYAEQVVSGEIPACQHVKNACQRQLDDLHKKDFKYDWNPTLIDVRGRSYQPAERICKFIELLPHIKGNWDTPNITLKQLLPVFGSSSFRLSVSL